MYSRVNGVGSWSGIVGGIGNFFESGIGQSLLQIGTAVGTGWLVNEIGGSYSVPGGNQSAPGSTPPTPAPPATVVIQQPPSGSNQAVTYTALALGGAALLYVLLKRK